MPAAATVYGLSNWRRAGPAGGYRESIMDVQKITRAQQARTRLSVPNVEFAVAGFPAVCASQTG